MSMLAAKNLRPFLLLAPLAVPSALALARARAAESDLETISIATAELTSRVLRATVRLSRDPDPASTMFGSGFVVDAARGLVVTNAHVVQDERAHVTATLQDGRHAQADVVGTDPATDLALLRIVPGFARYQLEWGESDELRHGTIVLAVGSPLDLAGSVSLGVVGGLNRTISPAGVQDYVQVDAFIDHGSSGGPLVNARGEVVGVCTAIRGETWRGIAYAVPSRIARRVAADLAEHGRARRSWLGVTAEDVTARYAEAAGLQRPVGARVQEAAAGSPAAAAGLRRGDVILAVDGHELRGRAHLGARLAAVPPGQDVELRLWRDGKLLTVRAVLAERPS